jgi:hypothetical protein
MFVALAAIIPATCVPKMITEETEQNTDKYHESVLNKRRVDHHQAQV